MEILTKRCIIRHFIYDDLDDFMTYRNNEAWMIYQTFKGLTKDKYASILIEEEQDINRGMQLALVHKETLELLGDLFLRVENHICYLGYTSHMNHARKGYIYESVQGIYQSLKEIGVTEIIAGVDPKNIASIRLLQKLGYIEEGLDEDGDITFRYHLTVY